MELKIKLGQYKNVNSTNVDDYNKIFLTKTESITTQYDTVNVLNVSDLYNNERQNCNRYKIYGKIEYLSLINNITSDYDSFIDLITPLPDYEDGFEFDKKTFENSFKFYLVKPSSETYRNVFTNTYVGKYEVISDLSNFKIFNAGYSVNLFNEKEFVHSFDIDVNLSGATDYFNHPINELFIYCLYQPQLNGSDISEIIEVKKYDSTGTSYYEQSLVTDMGFGNIFEGNLVSFDSSEYLLTTIDEFTHRIETFYSGASASLRWTYNPLIPIRISYMSDEYKIENISGTSYESIITIPYYAIKFNNDGSYIWRDILEKGYIDPLSTIGVNYPFVNNKHYVFSPLILAVKPDMSHPNTYIMFNQMIMDSYTIKSYSNKNTTNFGGNCDSVTIDCCS